MEGMCGRDKEEGRLLKGLQKSESVCESTGANSNRTA